MANTVRCFQSRSLGLDILARRRHHGNCSAFGSLGLGPYHRPLQAALSGSLIKAPGFAGGYLLAWEFPRLCRGGSRSLTYTAVGHPGNLRWLTHAKRVRAARPSINLKQSTGMANTVRCFHWRSLGLDILAKRRHHGNCSAFRSLELGPNHRPLQAALSGSLIKAPGFAGGYLLSSCFSPDNGDAIRYLAALRRARCARLWRRLRHHHCAAYLTAIGYDPVQIGI